MSGFGVVVVVNVADVTVVGSDVETVLLSIEVEPREAFFLARACK